MTSYPVQNIGQVGRDVPVIFGDSKSNRSRDIRLHHFVANDNNDDAALKLFINFKLR